MTIRIRLLVLAATAFTLVAIAPRADATFPGLNGRIAYNHAQYIHVIKPDGTGGRFLTQGARPAWSPDGTKIAFVRGSNDSSLGSSVDPGDIYVVNANGSGLRRLTYSDNGSGIGLWNYPNWSPDGTKIAATYGGHTCNNGVNNDIRIINAADGSLVSHFTASATCEKFPAWSPDGTRIAYLQYQSAGFCGIVVADLNYDGDEGKRYLPDSCTSGPVDWSPDGGSLVYGKQGIFVQTAAGTGPPLLLRAGGIEPKWSPDGTRIVFRTTKVGEEHSLYTMPAARTHGQSDVRVAIQGYFPDWGRCTPLSGGCFTHG